MERRVVVGMLVSSGRERRRGCCSWAGRGVAGGGERGADDGVGEAFARHVLCDCFDGFALVVGVVESACRGGVIADRGAARGQCLGRRQRRR